MTVPEIWAAVDIGKTHHHAMVINRDGERPLSRRVLNDESELLELIGDVLAISTDVLWAVDLNHGAAALLIGLLLSHGRPMAGFAGLAPQPRDCGRVSGNLRRPRRYHRGPLQAMYLSAMASLPTCPASKAYYRRKRNEGKGHKQALLALARRRLSVLWAMIRDGSCYHASPPVTAAA
ncbi:IS110 family transposase [Streptomyces bottropensis]|uniref:IS110 family transposase n=1 Tax=Streptomyces bottropensis TaxID=42235 RepID=UPI0036CCCD1D